MTYIKEIVWGKPVTVNNEPYFEDAGEDARKIHPGRFGSQYPRMLIIDDNVWMAVYTVYRNNGYIADVNGGTELAVAISSDQGETWNEIAMISDPGRDLDNGQLLMLKNGEILLACRSVIWQQSYYLPVYTSADKGYSWALRSVVDQNNGEPGNLGDPDRGVYEPHLLEIGNGDIAVMYASEKYACANPAYSQIIAEKVSSDNGVSWSDEIWSVFDENRSDARPGMPVWDQMRDGSFILVYEIIGPDEGDIFYKKSKDGVTWERGMGKHIPMQKGGPFILALRDNSLLITSNTHNVSISNDSGETWHTNPKSPWETLFNDIKTNGATCTVENGNVWPSIYKINDDKIIYMTSAGRNMGGNNIQFRFGELR